MVFSFFLFFLRLVGSDGDGLMVDVCVLRVWAGWEGNWGGIGSWWMFMAGWRLTSDVSDALQEGEEEYQKMHSQWVMKGQEADQEKHK